MIEKESQKCSSVTNMLLAIASKVLRKCIRWKQRRILDKAVHILKESDVCDLYFAQHLGYDNIVYLETMLACAEDEKEGRTYVE